MLENAILTLEQNVNNPAGSGSANPYQQSADDAIAAASSFGAFAFTLIALINLGLGLVYTFFGAKFIKYIISLFTGLFVASFVLLIFSGSNGVSTGGAIAAFVILVLVSYGCLKLEKIHAALLGFGIGIYVGGLTYLILLSYFTDPSVGFIVMLIAGIVGAVYGFRHAHKVMVDATAFLGANMIG